MDDFAFARIENAAHAGAFGENPQPEPSLAQCAAGNYKKGRTSIHGLPIVIEQPRGSTRTGTDPKTGKQWSSRMAAHYGYIGGTRGADGDEVDCFIGPWPQAQVAFVINQHVAGRFDEHKVMLCMLDEEMARRAYLNSYESGWPGLKSIVTITIPQLKWWLKHGDTSRSMSAAELPSFDSMEGNKTMKKVFWSADALPHDVTLDQVLYQVRVDDGKDGLLLDAVSAAEIVEDSEGVLALDALVSPVGKLDRNMQILRRTLERQAGNVKPVSFQITDPFKQRGVTNVAVIFELSDGQTVSIYFHNPDATPNRLTPMDELISWKWLLNKKDITIVVAPERGQDLNMRDVARRILRLAEKNSAAFQRANAGRAARMAGIQALQAEISALESELAAAQRELDVATLAADDEAAMAERIANASVGLPENWGLRYDQRDGKFRATYRGDDFSITGSAGDFDTPGMAATAARAWAEALAQAKEHSAIPQVSAEPSAEQIAQAEALGRKASGDVTAPAQDSELMAMIPADAPMGWSAPLLEAWLRGQASASVEAGAKTNGLAPDFDPTTPENYAKVMADKGLQEACQDRLDAFFEGRIIAVRDALRALGWMGREPSDTRLYKGDAELQPSFTHIGSGRNVVGWAMNGVGDDLTKTAGEYAAQVDGMAMAEMARRAQAAQQAPSEQELIAAYASSFGEAAAVLNTAVAAVNWDGITNNASMGAELDKLHGASRAGQNDIIGKASDALEAIGIKSWDERLSSLRSGPGFVAWREALDALRTTSDKIRAIALERLIAKGTAEVAALTAESPLADVAAAIFHKVGIDTGTNIPQIVAAIEAKDAALAWIVLSNLDNKASAEIFERATGVKLAKTQRDRRPQIDAWAGITPEQRAELDAQRTEAQAAKERDDNLKRAWSWLASFSVRADDGKVNNGQDFMKSLFANGFDEVVMRKRGAVPAYYVRNAAGQITGVKSKSFNGFLKAAMAYGGLRQALESLGVFEPKAEKTDAEKIATIDTAHRFTSATEEFKLWLMESLLKGVYSPFVSAKTLDEAAKRHGAEVEWGKSVSKVGSALDSIALDSAGGGLTKSQLSVVDFIKHQISIDLSDLATSHGSNKWFNVDTSDPAIERKLRQIESLGLSSGKYRIESNGGLGHAFYLTNPGGKVLDDAGHAVAVLEADPAASIKEAIGALTDGDYEPDETEIGATFDVEATLDSAQDSGPKEGDLIEFMDDSYTDKGPATGTVDAIKVTTDGLIVTVKFADAQETFSWDDLSPPTEPKKTDDGKYLWQIGKKEAVLDGVGEGGYVGKVKKDGEVRGLIDIADDGRALIAMPDGNPLNDMPRTEDVGSLVTAMNSLFAQAITVAEVVKSEAMAKQPRYESTRFVVKTDPIETKVEWQYLSGADSWDRLTTFPDLVSAKESAKSQGYDADSIPIWNSEWSASAGRFLPARPSQAKTGAAEIEHKKAEVEGSYTEPSAPPEVPELIAAGFSRVQSNDYVRSTQAGDKKLQFNVRLTDTGFVVRLTVGFAGGITGAATEIGRTAEVRTAIALVDAEAAKRSVVEVQPEPQKDADRALLQSVIDGTVPDILAPELADQLEAAYARNASDAEIADLFARAVAAYQSAMLAATA